MFSPRIEEIAAAVRNGGGLEFSAPGMGSRPVLLAPLDIRSDEFQVTLGADRKSVFQPKIETYQGRIIESTLHVARVGLSLVGDALSAQIEEVDGSSWRIRTNLESGRFEGVFVTASGRPGFACSIDAEAKVSTMRLADGSTHLVEDWSKAVPVTVLPQVMEQGGFDPGTTELDKFVDIIPQADTYGTSLKDLLLLMVMDKKATGSAKDNHLEGVVSRTLARLANMAAVYENQLGVRLLLHELVLIPDADSYTDVPSEDPLADFQSWLGRNRNRSAYGWSLAAKQGAGFSPPTVGIATIQRPEFLRIGQPPGRRHRMGCAGP